MTIHWLQLLLTVAWQQGCQRISSKDRQDLSTLVIEEGDILINSHDVVSLFTYTPINKVLDIVKDRLDKGGPKEFNKTYNFNLQSADVIELLNFILSTAYFTFRDKSTDNCSVLLWAAQTPPRCQHFHGACGGNCHCNGPDEHQPKLLKRYVDDILEVVRKESVKDLTEHLNKIDDTNSIKFRRRRKMENTFLDTLIVRRDDGSVKLLV